MYQTNLPFETGPHLPITNWLVDETLYSLCCRFHYLSCNATASRSAIQLFGHARHGTQHDFASRINVFVERTQGCFGATAKEIVYGHTILPFYLPWRTQVQANSVLQQLCAGNAGDIKALLGLPSSRVRAHHPLKFCFECIQSDRQQFGVAYWHLSHQLPGVWICSIHNSILMQSTQKATGVGRFLWYLPHDPDVYPSPPVLKAGASVFLLEQLAKAVIAVFKLSPDVYIDPCKLVDAYRHALHAHGLLRGSSQISLKEASEQYLQFTQAFNSYEVDLPIPNNEKQARQNLTTLLAFPRRATHPLRHLLFIIWLFEGWDEFWEVYKHVEPYHPHSDTATSTLVQKDADPRMQRLLDLVQNEGVAVSTAARQIGIAVQTAQQWASTYGIHIPRRSRTPTPVLNAMIRELLRGREKVAVADKYGVSLQAVSRLLKTEPGLQAQWTQAQWTAKLKARRSTWQRTVMRNPCATIKQIRYLQPSCYAWLYRHDKLWLTESLKQAPKKRGRSQSVDWDQRDTELVNLIYCTIQRIENEPDTKISVQQIYQQAPQIKPYLNKLKRLPKTKHLLDQIRTRSFASKNSTSK